MDAYRRSLHPCRRAFVGGVLNVRSEEYGERREPERSWRGQSGEHVCEAISAGEKHELLLRSRRRGIERLKGEQRAVQGGWEDDAYTLPLRALRVVECGGKGWS